MQITVVPTSINFFCGDFFIWNLLGCTAPTVCHPSNEGFSGSLFLPDPLVEIILLGPALPEPPLLDGGRPILEDVTEEPLAYKNNTKRVKIWSGMIKGWQSEIVKEHKIKGGKRDRAQMCVKLIEPKSNALQKPWSTYWFKHKMNGAQKWKYSNAMER